MLRGDAADRLGFGARGGAAVGPVRFLLVVELMLECCNVERVGSVVALLAA